MIDTTNKFMVGIQGGNVTILFPPSGPITKDEALVFAAWVVTLAGATNEQFEAVLDEVQSS